MWATHFIIVIKQCAATQQLHVSLLLLLQVDFAPTPGCKLGLCVSLSWKMAVMLSSVLQVPSMSDWHWECANLENKQQKAGRRKGSVRKIINCSNNKGFVQKKKGVAVSFTRLHTLLQLSGSRLYTSSFLHFLTPLLAYAHIWQPPCTNQRQAGRLFKLQVCERGERVGTANRHWTAAEQNNMLWPYRRASARIQYNKSSGRQSV